ncbi:MAG: hypothetical protein WBE76_10590 [Terracidiphilus sp.]
MKTGLPNTSSLPERVIIIHQMADNNEHNPPGWLLAVLSWAVSAYFLIGFFRAEGFPAAPILSPGDAALGVSGLFFLFLPFFNKIKIGKVLDLEREVEKAKEELGEFKTEVRNSLSVLSTNVNSISGMTNRINFYNNVPTVPQMEREAQVLDENAPETVDAAKEVQRDLLQQDDDIVISLFKTRVEIERLLREIVGKSTSLSPGKDVRMAGLPQLFGTFLAQNPKYKYLQNSLRYVNQVCSAAIHAQQVSEDQAREVLALGAKIVATLKEFQGGFSPSNS